MTEGTDGFFEAYTCCFKKIYNNKFKGSGIKKEAEEKSCCYWSHGRFLQHVQSQAGRMVNCHFWQVTCERIPAPRTVRADGKEAILPQKAT